MHRVRGITEDGTAQVAQVGQVLVGAARVDAGHDPVQARSFSPRWRLKSVRADLRSRRSPA
jgi:hypothetical protein